MGLGLCPPAGQAGVQPVLYIPVRQVQCKGGHRQGDWSSLLTFGSEFPFFQVLGFPANKL